MPIMRNVHLISVQSWTYLCFQGITEINFANLAPIPTTNKRYHYNAIAVSLQIAKVHT